MRRERPLEVEAEGGVPASKQREGGSSLQQAWGAFQMQPKPVQICDFVKWVLQLFFGPVCGADGKGR